MDTAKTKSSKATSSHHDFPNFTSRLTYLLSSFRVSAQPLFDCVPLMTFDVLIETMEVKQVSIHFGSNRYAIGTRFESIGMTLQATDGGSCQLLTEASVPSHYQVTHRSNS